MTDASAATELSAADAFEAALTRARAAEGDPLPVLSQIDPAKGPSRRVAEMRGMLSRRFAYAVPAAQAALLHRETVRALGRLERSLRWRRIRTVVAGFLRTYGWAILGLVVLMGLLGLAFVYRDPILTFIASLLTPAPTPAPAPAVTTPPAVPGALAPTGTVP